MKIEVQVCEREQRFRAGDEVDIKIGPLRGTFELAGIEVMTPHPGGPRDWTYTFRSSGTVTKGAPEDFLEAALSFIHEATEEELDEALRAVGEDPREVAERAKRAIDSALERASLGRTA
jgi:hypothetical protein